MEDELIAFGGELKALGDGRVGGVLVRMTNANEPDLTGDYFDATKSDVRSPDTLDVYYNHGMDGTLKKRIIGKAKISRMDNGDVWAETQLNMRDEYEKAIYAMAEAGKLGYSSGALSHLVDREPAGKGVWMIKTWVIGEASLTPTPAEFRNTVTTLKAFTTPDAALPDKEESTQIKTNMEITMEEQDIKSLVAAELEKEAQAREAKQAAEAARQVELKAAADAAYKQALEDVKSNKAPAYHSTEPVDDDNDGVGAFKSWMKTGQENQGLIRPDESFNIKDAKAAWNVSTGGSGGFLVPDPLYNTIVAKRNLSSWVRQAPVQSFQTPSDHLLVPRESTSQAAWTLTAEANDYTENEGTVTQKDLILYKYTKLTKVSEEFLMYNTTNWESWFSNALGRSVGVTENTMFTSGGGTSEPEGIATGATASSLTIKTSAQLNPEDLTALIGKLGAGYNVPAECGFVGANASKWYLKNAILGGPFAYIGAQGGAPAPEFFGYPFYVSDDVQSYTATSLVVLYFGNLNYYGIVEKPGIIVQRNPYLYMANGQIGIFASIFRGGGVLQSEAIYSVNGK
jgi:HK97 family phage major capsid protein